MFLLNMVDLFAKLLTLYPIEIHDFNMATKTKWLRVRLDEEEEQLLERWSKAYGEDRSAFVRRLLRSLPNNPKNIPTPPIKL